MTLKDHLQAVYDEYGYLTPQLVLDVARPKKHPLHASVFSLPPGEAAEAWYLQRAQELITRVKIVYKKSPRGERSVRQWHAIRKESGYVYEPADKIASEPFLRELLLRDMDREWRQLKDRYMHMREFVELVKRDLGEAEAA